MLSSGGNLQVAYDIVHDPMHPVYLKKVYQFAEHNSKDTSTQNAAMIVHPSKGIISLECNGLPDNIASTEERWKRPNKYKYVEHAERNAIYKAARMGISTQDTIMYCPWFSCSDCSRAIIQAGIKTVVGHKPFYDIMPKRWKDSCEVGLQMLNEAGVLTIYWKEPIGKGISIRVNGKIFNP
jgi:dCMP deaminase